MGDRKIKIMIKIKTDKDYGINISDEQRDSKIKKKQQWRKG